MLAADRAFGTEVFVADADVLLGDACNAIKTGQRSELLRAIDTGTARAFMSEQAYWEIGRMSAVSARGNGVDHPSMRTLLEAEYLPRIPVVRTTSTAALHWMPSANDVGDPDDVAHVQLARLIGARAIYSHDKDLRRPGFAPRTRVEYEQRVVHLSVLSTRSETELGVSAVIGLAGGGTAEVVSWASVRFEVKSAVLWMSLALVFVAVSYIVLAPPERRRRIAGALEPVIERLGDAFERSETARRQLASTVLVTPVQDDRVEVRVGAHLARHPDLNMGEIRDSLDLTQSERRQLSALLSEHPSFEPTSRWGWSVGRRRNGFSTHPSATWKPRPTK